jgi:hypothetical protein
VVEAGSGCLCAGLPSQLCFSCGKRGPPSFIARTSALRLLAAGAGIAWLGPRELRVCASISRKIAPDRGSHNTQYLCSAKLSSRTGLEDTYSHIGPLKLLETRQIIRGQSM